MNSRAAFVVVALAAVLVTGPATIAQMTLQPTSRPIVTAENEPWYRGGRAYYILADSLLSGRADQCTSTATRWYVPGISKAFRSTPAPPSSLTVLYSCRWPAG